MNIKLFHYGTLSCLVVLLFAGCASTADPRVDSIGFDPRRAERERLDPMREQLANEEDDTSAEHIRSITLRSTLGTAQTSTESIQVQIETLRRKKAAAEQELRSLDTQVEETRSTGRAQDALIRRRNEVQAKVDQLSANLRNLLQSQ
jgi:septal ring factor EnvC (AmiA/AmiB activator)